MRVENPWGRELMKRARSSRVSSVIAAAVAVKLVSPVAVWADLQPVTQSGGLPELPHATFEETGLPNFSMPVGKPTFPDGTVVPVSASGNGPDNNPGGSTSADTVLQGRSWGALASLNASAIGVNPTALAAACVVESGCQNVSARAGGTVSGAFQMTDGTYNADIRQALAQNPSLAGSIDTSLGGKIDPAN